MAFHRIGDSVYSDEELRAHNESTMNILVPAVVTAIGIYFLHGWLSPMAYFMVHTTTEKVIYLVSGLILFCLGYTFRKLIVALVALLVVVGIFFLMGAIIWQWLSA